MSAILAPPPHKCLGVRGPLAHKCLGVRSMSAMELAGACAALGILALVWLAGAGAAYVW